MNGETVIIYREEQMFAGWLRWLVNISMIAAALLSVFALRKEFSGQNPPDTPELILAITAGIGVPILIVVLFFFLKLETEVRPDGLYLRYIPFHNHFRKFAPDDFRECYARQYKPIREYGGWGIRCGLFGMGRAYNVSGNKGVQLVFNNGKKLLIGSQRAEELEQAIRSIIRTV